MRLPPWLVTLLRCVGAGGCIALAVPPFGWWPLAFVGIALADRLIAGRPWRSRFRRMWLVAAVWLFPATFWMIDLTPPGYVIAQAVAAAMFGLAAAAGTGTRTTASSASARRNHGSM